MRRAMAVSLAILLAMASTAGAVTKTWSNAAGGPWTTVGNWGGVLPVAGDDVVLGTAISSNVNVTACSTISLLTMTVNNTSGLYTLWGSSSVFTLTGTGTSLSVGATGVNFFDPTRPWQTYTYATSIALPTTTSTTWDIGGPALIGNLTGGLGGATPTSLTKIGTGVLTLASRASTSSPTGYAGDLKINQGEVRVTGLYGNLNSFTLTPTLGSDVTLSGDGWLTFVKSTLKPATIRGAGSNYAIIAPGANSAAGTIGQLRLGGGPGNDPAPITATVGDLSQYNADVSTARSGYSDQFNVGGTLDLGTGLNTTLNLNVVGGGSLNGGYVLAAATTASGLTGTFTNVTGKPAGTSLIYSPRALWLVNDAAPRWLRDAATGNSFGTAANWSTPLNNGGAGDGTQSLILTDCITAARTLTLDGNKSVKDLMIWSGLKYTIQSGAPSPSTLTLTSGNMYIDAGATNANGHDLRDVILKVGDGVTPVTDAVWTFYNANAGTSSTGKSVIGVVQGIAGTVLTINGNTPVTFAGNNSDFHGRYVLSLFNPTSGGSGSGIREYVEVSTNNALGGAGSTCEMNFSAGALWFRNTNTQVANIIVNPSSTGAAGNYIQIDCTTTGTPIVYSTTLNGNLTGTGVLNINMTGNNSGTGYLPYGGRLIVNGPANTLSGDVLVAGYHAFEVDGVWTGAGNLAIWKGSLEGTGSIGMAAGKAITVSGTTYGMGTASIAPGTKGTIGTLTTGTTANNVVFNSNATAGRGSFNVDLAGDTEGLSDLLAIHGAMTVTNADLYLALIDNGDLNGVYTLATYTSRTGTFSNVYFKDSPMGSYVLVSDPTAAGGVDGTHQLIYGATSLTLDGPALMVPEPGTLLLLGTGLLGALGYARRRRMV